MSEHNYFPKYITRLPRIARLFFKKIGFLQHAAEFPLALDSEPSYTCSTLHKTLNVGAKEMMKELEPCDRRSGYTLIELLEAIVAIAIGACLADTASMYFEGIGQKVVYWTIATVGSAIIFLCLLFGIGYLFHFRTRGQSKSMQKTMTRGTDTSDKTQ